MTSNETRRYEMLQRVVTFGETHQDLFPAASVGGQALERVTAAVTQLGKDTVSTMSAARGGRRAKTVARDALVGRLEAIARSARVMASDEPGFDDPFHLPVPRTDQALVTTGRVFVRDAEAVKSRFIAYGVPEDFLERLNLAVEEFEQAIRTREEKRGGRAAARASSEAAFASAFDALRKLDVIVINRLQEDPVTMAVWEKGRRVDPVRRTKAVNPVEAAAPAAAVAPAVVENAVESPAEPVSAGAVEVVTQ